MFSRPQGVILLFMSYLRQTTCSVRSLGRYSPCTHSDPYTQAYYCASKVTGKSRVKIYVYTHAAVCSRASWKLLLSVSWDNKYTILKRVSKIQRYLCKIHRKSVNIFWKSYYFKVNFLMLLKYDSTESIFDGTCLLSEQMYFVWENRGSFVKFWEDFSELFFIINREWIFIAHERYHYLLKMWWRNTKNYFEIDMTNTF